MEFWRETKPAAHIEHKCDACGHAIKVGEHYAYMAGKYDGYFFSVKQHLECRAVECELAELKDLWGGDEWCHLNDLEEPDDLFWLQEHHPVVFERLKLRYSRWLENEVPS